MITDSSASIFGDPSAGHPVRRKVRCAVTEVPPGKRITANDVREFLMAYCACFLAVSTFLL